MSDQAQRQQALTINHSFIVQAPAGSGKTELLTQRYLKLLAHVEQPESIIAITFTRKAAAEMHDRILSALQVAVDEAKPMHEPQASTYDLAKAVLANDQHYDWQLLQYPHRLRLQTIDSFCLYLAKQLPLSSQFSQALQPIDDATSLYQQAAEATLALLQEDSDYTDSIEQVLRHVDNQYQSAKQLISNMLRHRDQWLPILLAIRHHEDVRAKLELGLQSIIQDTLEQVIAHIPKTLIPELLELLQFAAQNLAEAGSDSKITLCHKLTDLPDTRIETLAIWQCLAYFLLTNEGIWRKQVNKNLGFPPPSEIQDKSLKACYQQYKQRYVELIQQLAQQNDLLSALQTLQQCPAPHYSESQWQTLQALLTLLPLAAAQLQHIFQQQQQIDYIAIAQAALQALGNDCEPSHLALQLDYNIQHILVDEFQDTSSTQLRLLQLLTQGWHENDGHSLFLVGDPMQSIYSFRAAEVGLFLQVQRYGLGQIKPIALKLQANFRSDPTLVNWFNINFVQLFPQQADISSGAIPFSPSQAQLPKQAGVEICLRHYDTDHPDQQAQAIANTIHRIRQQSPQASIAILLRSRQQVQHWLPTLQQANIAYQAIELEKLNHVSVIQDLTALTLALLHPAQRIAWFSILRAPWCGLSLSDLTLLANTSPRSDILWEPLNRTDVLQQLSADGQQRLARILPVLRHSLQQRQRLPLRQWVESTWIALGGACVLQQAQEQQQADSFWQLLETFSYTDLQSNTHLLQQQLKTLYVQPLIESDNPVQILTIHKAKGLEFDVVILPDLEQTPRSEPHQLLLWMQYPHAQHDIDFVLAPISNSSTNKHDPTYSFIRQQRQKKRQLEVTRLLYVAATRAKQQLYLFTRHSSEQWKNPPKHSFLQLLAPCSEQFSVIKDNMTRLSEPMLDQSLQRLPADYRLPDAWQTRIKTIHHATPSSTVTTSLLSQQQSLTAQAIGTVIHQLLQLLSQTPYSNWMWQLQQTDVWHRQLQQLIVPETEIKPAIATIIETLKTVIHSQRAQWILNCNYAWHRSELAVSGMIEEKLDHCVIDRTFIDQEQCWIVDYKTSQPSQGQSLDEFLQEKKSFYKAQLQRYTNVLSPLVQQPIQCGLYFPILDAWTIVL